MAHKEFVTVDLASSSPSMAASPAHTHLLTSNEFMANKNSRAYTDIFLACVVIRIPMMALSGALLGILLVNRVIQTESDDTSSRDRYSAEADYLGSWLKNLE